MPKLHHSDVFSLPEHSPQRFGALLVDNPFTIDNMHLGIKSSWPNSKYIS